MPFLVQLFELIGSFVASKAGMAVVAFGLGWVITSIRADEHCRAKIEADHAAQAAAYWKEIEREKAAARQIAEDATKRAESDSAVIEDMQKELEDYSKKEAENVKRKAPNTCVYGRRDINELLHVTAAANRKANASRRSR